MNGDDLDRFMQHVTDEQTVNDARNFMEGRCSEKDHDKI